MKSKKKVKRVVNSQKIFCFISFIFILICCLWYGGRFVYFYLDSKKAETSQVAMADVLKQENHSKKSFRKDGNEYYFYQDVDNNYVKYSNLLWRIVKINKDNSILLVMDDSITSLAYGEDVKYQDSPLIKWLNKDEKKDFSGQMEGKLNDVSHYLVKTSVCIDTVDDIEKIDCKTTVDGYYLGLLSLEDYVKTGGKKSFINHNSISYFANQKADGTIWYLNDDGTLDTSSGDDLFGVRATVTLSPALSIKSGTGTKDDAYVIEDKFELFGSYVKLGNDMWRIYDVKQDQVKLVSTDYVKSAAGSKYESIYSNPSFVHNDTVSRSLAYYLNHTYLNSLSYKNLILNANYYNGYYGEDTNYQLDKVYGKEIDTHVAVPSLGDVVFHHELDNYFISTGTYQNSSSVYLQNKNSEVVSKKVTSQANVVACITIKRDNLSGGSGTMDDPYRTE